VPEIVRRRTALIETVRVRQGRSPLWALHEERLFRSAAALGLRLPDELTRPSGGADRICRFEYPGRGRARLTERRVEELDGLRLRTSRVPHRGYRHKTTNREWLDAARLDAASEGADDVLLLSEEGFVAESSIWSLFWWEAGRLAAPPLALGILPGVARARLAQVAGELLESRLPGAELARRGGFAANAGRGIVPLVELDGIPVVPERATTALAQAFWP
jgi:branched-subunit amino acid aminotransferase/4-amino-4-deoxychorismate lyase